jgi:hypothetical protein
VPYVTLLGSRAIRFVITCVPYACGMRRVWYALAFRCSALASSLALLEAGQLFATASVFHNPSSIAALRSLALCLVLNHSLVTQCVRCPRLGPLTFGMWCSSPQVHKHTLIVRMVPLHGLAPSRSFCMPCVCGCT